MIFANPTQTFMLFPIPISIPAWAVGMVLLAMDFMTMNVAGFGGTSAAYLMVKVLK